MCGIAGTIFNHNFPKGSEVTASDLMEIFNDITINYNTEKFLDECWAYKSNINFIRYFNDANERKRIDDLVQLNIHFVHVEMHNIVKNFECQPNLLEVHL